MNMFDILSLYFFYVKTTVKSWFQYKLDACLRSFAVFMREAAGIIIIYLVFQSFDLLNGWNYMELFFLYSFIFLTYGILIIFFTGMRDFDRMVVSGQLDRFLLRPRGVLFQILASNSDWFAAIGHGSLGLFLLIFTANQVNVSWSFVNILYLFIAIISGVLIQGAIFIFIGSCSFFIMKIGNLRNLIYFNAKQFAGYPITIYPKIVQIFMIYIIPFAFVNFFPAEFFLHKPDIDYFSPLYIYLVPFVGVVMYFLSYLFWRFCLKYYHSSGN